MYWQYPRIMECIVVSDIFNQALAHAQPEIFNTDQGAQFTAHSFTGRLAEVGIRISMDGRGRALDNIFVERLWRSVKYEDIYLKHYETVPALERGLQNYFDFYNHERPHQSLGYRMPSEVYTPNYGIHHFSELNFTNSWS